MAAPAFITKYPTIHYFIIYFIHICQPGQFFTSSSEAQTEPSFALKSTGSSYNPSVHNLTQRSFRRRITTVQCRLEVSAIAFVESSWSFVKMDSAAVEIDGSVMEGVSTRTYITTGRRAAVVLIC